MRCLSVMHDEMPRGNIKDMGTGVTRYVSSEDEVEIATINSFSGAPARSMKAIFPAETSTEE